MFVATCLHHDRLDHVMVRRLKHARYCRRIAFSPSRMLPLLRCSCSLLSSSFFLHAVDSTFALQSGSELFISRQLLAPEALSAN